MLRRRKNKLDTLPDNLAVLCFSYLNANDQAKMKCVNEWAKTAVNTFENMLPCWSNAIVQETHPDTFTTVASAACANAQAKPSFGILFSSIDESISITDMQQIRDKCPADFQCVAVSTAGVSGIQDGRTPLQLEEAPACSLTVGHLPRSDVEIFSLDDFQRGNVDPELDWKVFIVLLSGGNGGASFLHRIQQLFPKVTVVGGLCEQKPIGILKNKRIRVKRMNGVVLALRGEGVIFNSQVSMACRPLTEFCTIHRHQVIPQGPENAIVVVQQVRTSEGTIMNALDLDSIANRTANQHIPLYLGLGHADGLTLYHYDTLDRQDYSALVLRTDGSQDLPGLGVRIYGLDGPSSREDIKRRLQAGARACANQSRDVLGGLLFTCCGRTSPFYDGDENVEISLFRNVFPRQQIGGFLCYGEIGPRFQAGSDPDNPVREKAYIQGYTAVYGMFFVPKILPQLQAATTPRPGATSI